MKFQFHLTNIAPNLRRALIFSQVMALIWWLAALVVRNTDLIPVWFDQEHTFMQVGHHLSEPYTLWGFLNPPWAALYLAPFSLLPLEIAVLIQLCLYFAILTGLIFKFGGRGRAVALTLISFLALNNALELNIDWLVALGMLVPVTWSAPFLLVKPQAALGYYLGAERHELLRALIVALVLVVISLLLWGFWIEPMLAAAQRNLFSNRYSTIHNIAPRNLMPTPIALLIGVILSIAAFRRRDPVLGVFGWLFFVPYLAFYSLLLPLALIAARWWRVALLISVLMWLLYGGVIIAALLTRLAY